jgi:hypothetical protein
LANFNYQNLFDEVLAPSAFCPGADAGRFLSDALLEALHVDDVPLVLNLADNFNVVPGLDAET